MGIPDHLTCLLRNLYAGQEATVRTGRGITDWFQIGNGSKLEKEYVKAVYCYPAYLTYMQRTSWETLGWKKHELESRSGIKIAGRSNNNLHADDTTFMAESEEELKSLLRKVKEESEKVGLKLIIQKIKIMACGPITSWEIDGETVTDFFGGLQNHCRWWLQPWN